MPVEREPLLRAYLIWMWYLGKFSQRSRKPIALARGSSLGGIEIYRKYFDLWVNKTDKEGYFYWVRIERGKEDYRGVLEKIKEYYKELGGKL